MSLKISMKIPRVGLVTFIVIPTLFVLSITTAIEFQIAKNAVNTGTLRSTEQALRAIAKIIAAATDPIDEIRSFNSGFDTIGYLVDLRPSVLPCVRSKFNEECKRHVAALRAQHGQAIDQLAISKSYSQYQIDGKRFNFIVTPTSISGLYGLMAVEGHDFGPDTDALVDVLLISSIAILLVAGVAIALATKLITRPILNLVDQIANIQDDKYKPLVLNQFQPVEIVRLNEAVNEARLNLLEALAETQRRSKQVENYQRQLRHDLKSASLGAYNMVMALQMFAESLDEDMQEVLANAIHSSKNAYELVHFTSKLEQFENMEFATHKPSEIRDNLLPNFSDENVLWKVPDEPEIEISYFHFCRALSNLITNAIKYSDPQKVVKVNFISNETSFFFIVEDQGYGIPAENLDKIFELGLQSRLKPEIEGTGVGLHSARECIQKHGGTIKVSSRFGEGSTFAIACPRRATE